MSRELFLHIRALETQKDLEVEESDNFLIITALRNLGKKPQNDKRLKRESH